VSRWRLLAARCAQRHLPGCSRGAPARRRNHLPLPPPPKKRLIAPRNNLAVAQAGCAKPTCSSFSVAQGAVTLSGSDAAKGYVDMFFPDLLTPGAIFRKQSVSSLRVFGEMANYKVRTLPNSTWAMSTQNQHTTHKGMQAPPQHTNTHTRT
jgi:hypothetical protein